MKLVNCKKETFLSLQTGLEDTNFLKSNEMYELQVARNNYLFTERLAFVEDEKVIGLTIINYRRK